MEALSSQSLEASLGKQEKPRKQAFEYVLKYSGRFTNRKQYEI
jgi:HAE1 family hydrophobic/amphiphilic exporter-1